MNFIFPCNGSNSAGRFNLTFAVPHAFPIIADPGVDKTLLGNSFANGSAIGLNRGICGKFGSPVNCSPYPMNPVLRRNYSKIDPVSKTATGEWVISPYFPDYANAFDLNVEIADKMATFGML